MLPFFFMVQCITFMTSYTTINDSLWVQCFLWRSTGDDCLRQKTHVNFSFRNCFSLQLPQIHHIAGKNGFIDSKNPVSISSLNQGNHNMGHLWIQTDYNLDHKCPDYGQPVTINMCDQTGIMLYVLWQSMTSLFLYVRSTRVRIFSKRGIKISKFANKASTLQNDTISRRK